MKMPLLLLLSFALQTGDQQDPLFSRTVIVNGKEVPQFRHFINKHPRTGVVTDHVAWTSMELQRKAYLHFYEQLPLPVFKAETSAEREAILKAVVQQFLQKQITPGMPVEKAEAFLLENGFYSFRRSAGLPPNTISLYGRERIKHGLFDWNSLFVVSVHLRFDDARRVTEVFVQKALFTYSHKGV